MSQMVTIFKEYHFEPDLAEVEQKAGKRQIWEYLVPAAEEILDALSFDQTF
jgi:hypothetical protein